MSTFAIPNEKRGAKGPQVWLQKFIEKTETVQEASTEKNTIYREALILLKELRSVSDKLRII